MFLEPLFIILVNEDKNVNIKNQVRIFYESNWYVWRLCQKTGKHKGNNVRFKKWDKIAYMIITVEHKIMYINGQHLKEKEIKIIFL